MRYKSRAIALNYIKHGEGSIISKMLTEEKGLQSFIIKGVRSKGAKKRLNLFEPLQLSNINATFLAKKNLQQLIDINLAPCHANINIKKKLNLFLNNYFYNCFLDGLFRINFFISRLKRNT